MGGRRFSTCSSTKGEGDQGWRFAVLALAHPRALLGIARCPLVSSIHPGCDRVKKQLKGILTHKQPLGTVSCSLPCALPPTASLLSAHPPHPAQWDAICNPFISQHPQCWLRWVQRETHKPKAHCTESASSLPPRQDCWQHRPRWQPKGTSSNIVPLCTPTSPGISNRSCIPCPGLFWVQTRYSPHPNAPSQSSFQ